MRFRTSVFALLFFFGLFALFKAPSDPDFGWHYKYGQYIVQNGSFLRENTFSYTFTDYKWANSYWVSQVLMFATHSYFGHAWAGLLFSCGLSLAVIWYVRALGKKLGSGLAITTLVAIFMLVNLYNFWVVVRPMYFSCLFLMLLAVLLLNDFGGARPWILPILFLIWANIHADFVLGLFVLGLYTLDRLGVAGFFAVSLNSVLRFARKRFWQGEARQDDALVGCLKDGVVGASAKNLPPPLAIALISLAVTVINPHGFHLWETLIKESHPYQFKHIAEWVPVTTENAVKFAAYCSFLGFLISALVAARQKLPVWYMLAVGVFCILSLRSQYFLRVAVILGVHALLVFWTPYASDIAHALPFQVVRKIKLGFMAFMLFTTFAAFAVFSYEVRQSIDEDYWLEKGSYPGKALDWVLANNIAGNVFNYYGWGGYMIWQYPQIKTFVDGRMPSWREDGRSVFEDYISVVDDPAKNYHILDAYGIDWILYPTESVKSKFLDFLSASPNWRQVYRDDVSAVFVRN